MSGEEDENAAELKIPAEFLKAKCLMNCEVSLILEHKYEQLQQMSEVPMNQMSQVFEKSLQYVKCFSRYKNPDAVKQVREILSRYQLAEFELCVLGNLCPETVEEAMAMVPSIKTRGRAHDDEAIEKMLNDLSLIKKLEYFFSCPMPKYWLLEIFSYTGINTNNRFCNISVEFSDGFLQYGSEILDVGPRFQRQWE